MTTPALVAGVVLSVFAPHPRQNSERSRRRHRFDRRGRLHGQIPQPPRRVGKTLHQKIEEDRDSRQPVASDRINRRQRKRFDVMRIRQERHELSVAQRTADDHLRHAHDAGAFDGEPQRRLGVVGGDARAHFNDVDAGARFERPAVETGPRHHDAVVLAQVGGDLRRAALCEIGWGGADHALQIGDLALDELALRDVARAHGNVGLLLQQIDEPVGDRQGEVDLRVARKEIGERRRELMQAECSACVNMKGAARGAAHAHHLGLGLLDVGDDLPSAGKEALALRGQHQAPGTAFQQPSAQPVLQPRNQL